MHLKHARVLVSVIGFSTLVLVNSGNTSFAQNQQSSLELVVELQTTKNIPVITERELSAAQRVIENRVRVLGISKPVIEIEGKNQLLVQLPGVKDPAPIIRVLEKTAQLEFKEQKSGTQKQFFQYMQERNELSLRQQQYSNSQDQAESAKNQAALKNNSSSISKLFKSTNPPLTGAYITTAFVEGKNNIGINFNNTGARIFAQLTKNLAGTERAVGIFIDNEIISSPTVSSQFKTNGITGGAAVITGNFKNQEAQNLSIQLTSGALPVPIKVKLKR